MKIVESIKAGVEPVSLKRMIHQRIPHMEPARSHKVIHGSAVTAMDETKRWCPRQYALMDLTKKKQAPEFIGTSQQVTFDYGHFLQAKINNEWLGDEMVGDWKCRACGSTKSFCKKPGHCGKSGIHCQWEYEEPRPVSKVSGISCGIDALVVVGLGQKLRLAEIKSMVKDQFKNLKAPLAEHRARTNLYMRCIEESEEPWASRINLQTASVLYVQKGYGTSDKQIKEWGLKDAPFSPFKEYEVTRSDTDTQDYVNIARALTLFRAGEAGIPCGICPNALTKRSKHCPVMKECFSGKYPGQVTWLEGGKPAHPGKKVAT